MTYASVLARQSKEVTTFAKITRKKKILYSELNGSGEVSFPYGTPVSVTASDGTATNASIYTAVLSTYDWSYNASTQVLDLPLSLSDEFGNTFTSVASSVFFVEYESRFASEEVVFHDIPTSSASSIVKWNEGILNTPEVRRSVADAFGGLLTSESSPLVVAHNGSNLWESLYDESFFRCRVDIWQCVGPLRTTNCQKIFSGLIDSVTFNDVSIEFSLIENTRLIDGSYRGRFYTSDTFTKLDPSFEGRPIPICYGNALWVRAVNIDYISDGATTSDNRVWAVYDKRLIESGTQNLTLGTVTALPAPVYRISGMAEADVRCLKAGDRIRRSSDGAWAFVLEVESSTQIRIQTITVHTPAVGNLYVRPAIQNIYFQVPSKQATVLLAQINDSSTISYSETDDVVTVNLTSGFEAYATALGITTIDPNDFEVWVEVCGAPQRLLFDGAYIGQLDFNDNVSCLYWYLTHVVGIPDDYINGQSFIDAIAVMSSSSDEALFTHPIWSSDFEDHKTVIGRLLATLGAIGYFNNEGKFTIKLRGVLGTPDFELTDADLIGRPQYEIRHEEIVAFQLDASSEIVGVQTNVLKTKPSTFANVIRTVQGPIDVPFSSRFGRAQGSLDNVSIQTYDINRARGNANLPLWPGLRRRANYCGRRRLLCKVRASGEVLDAEPGDIVSLTRELVPGEARVAGTEFTRKYFVVETARDGAAIDLVLDDQFSIEENGSL